jgi:hypothetical protein
VRARTHQNLIWSRQRQANALRSTLREFYPAALAAFDELARWRSDFALGHSLPDVRRRSLGRARRPGRGPRHY